MKSHSRLNPKTNSVSRFILPQRRNGFALLAVIWGVGAIAAIILPFMTNSRLRLQAASHIAYATKADFLTEGATNLATLGLLSTGPRGEPVIYDGTPRFCLLDGVTVAISIQDESGKIDLNAATPVLLWRLLTGLGLDDRSASTITKAIVRFRSPDADEITESQSTTEVIIAPKHAPFETVMELDQVNGINAGLFRTILPFVTVHSRNPGIDSGLSPPALFAAISGSPADEVKSLIQKPFPNTLNRSNRRFPPEFYQAGDRSAFLIHAETILPTGQSASREVLVDVRPSDGAQFKIKEFRRAQSYFGEELRAAALGKRSQVPEC